MVDVIFIKMGNAVGIDEMGIIPTSDKATCLGFSQKLVDRLEVPITKTRSLRENLGVEIRWDNQGSYRGGVVELRVASMINYYGGSLLDDPQNLIMTSRILVEHDYVLERDGKIRNPFESLTSLFVLVATANLIGNRIGPINHVVATNPASAPYFIRLMENGLYEYSDNRGGPSSDGRINGYNDYTFFCQKYPIQDASGISKFASLQAADIFSSAFLKIKKP